MPPPPPSPWTRSIIICIRMHFTCSYLAIIRPKGEIVHLKSTSTVSLSSFLLFFVVRRSAKVARSRPSFFFFTSVSIVLLSPLISSVDVCIVLSGRTIFSTHFQRNTLRNHRRASQGTCDCKIGASVGLEGSLLRRSRRKCWSGGRWCSSGSIR